MLAELVAQRSAGDGAVDPLLAECIAPSEQARGDSLGVWRTAPEFHEAMYKPRGNPVLETVACAWAPSSRDKCSARLIWRLTKSMFSTPTVNWRPPSPEDAPLAPSENHVGDIMAVVREQTPQLVRQINGVALSTRMIERVQAETGGVSEGVRAP